MMIGFASLGIHGTPVGNNLDVLDISADGQPATRTTVNLPLPAQPQVNEAEATRMVRWILQQK